MGSRGSERVDAVTPFRHRRRERDARGEMVFRGNRERRSQVAGEWGVADVHGFEQAARPPVL